MLGSEQHVSSQNNFTMMTASPVCKRAPYPTNKHLTVACGMTTQLSPLSCTAIRKWIMVHTSAKP